MRYQVTKSTIDVVGTLWMPGVTAATTYTLTDSDVKNLLPETGDPSRDDVESWLMAHSGDFANVIDFRASIAVGDKDFDFDFADEESELTFNDCTFGDAE